MRAHLLIRFVLSAVVASCLIGFLMTGADAAPPGLVAKQAQAKQVLAQISAIDERLSVITERFDAARVSLTRLRGNLKVERASLKRARTRYHGDQLRVARLLVSIYESPAPSPLEVILGARSVAEIARATEAQEAISHEDTRVAAAAAAAKERVARRVQRLERDRTAAAATVRELVQERAQMEQGLAERRTLLSSVERQIQGIEARERARQARLAAAARARLVAEQAALERRAAAAAAAKQRADALARAQALAQAQQEAAQATTTATTTTATTTTPVAETTTTTTSQTTTVAATTTTASAGGHATAFPLLTTLPLGHPQVAQIALGYLGVPYLWGGASPSGFDCSGLVTYSYAQLGIQLPHSAADQYGFGVAVPKSQLQAGDLVFFDHLDHVGIYIGNNEFVDAPHTGAYVRIDSLSEPWYSTRYVGARRI